MTTDPDTWHHVATNILLLNEEELKILRDKSIRKIAFFYNMNDVTRLSEIYPDKDGLYYELEDFCRYIIGHNPSYCHMQLWYS